MGAAAIRILNFAGEIADASADTGSHKFVAVNGSTLTFLMPMSWNFLRGPGDGTIAGRRTGGSAADTIAQFPKVGE